MRKRDGDSLAKDTVSGYLNPIAKREKLIAEEELSFSLVKLTRQFKKYPIKLSNENV